VPFPFAGASGEWQPRVLALQLCYGDPLFDYGGAQPPQLGSFELHEVIMKMSTDLADLMPAQVAYALPRLLVYILEDYPGGAVNAPDVMSLFDLSCALPDEVLQAPEHAAWIPAYMEIVPSLADDKRLIVRALDRDQLSVVLDWFRFVREWPEMDWYRSSFDRVIAMWSQQLDSGWPPAAIANPE
jgi:hypothetical protein